MNRQPSTPPRVNDDEDINPFTPDLRKDGRGKREYKMLFTPQTPSVSAGREDGEEEDSGDYLLPRTPIGKNNSGGSGSLKGESHGRTRALLALRTPEMTPRHERKGGSSGMVMRGSQLDFGKCVKIEETSKEDSESEDSEDSDGERGAQIAELSAQMIVPDNRPSTPTGQLMDDAYIEKMFGEERCGVAGLDDLAETVADLHRGRKVIANPFISSRSKRTTSAEDTAHNNSRYAKELELVYHPTGARFWVPLLPKEKEREREKGKKNLFEKLAEAAADTPDTPEDLAEDLFSTPRDGSGSAKRRQVLSVQSLLNKDTTSSDDMETQLGVRRAPVANPFLTAGKRTDKSDTDKSPAPPAPIDAQGRIQYVQTATGRSMWAHPDTTTDNTRPRKLHFD